MPQKFLKWSSKFEMGSISTCDQFRCRNCSKCEQFRQQNFPTFLKAFHSVNFLLTNSQLVHSLVLFIVLSGWVPFLVFFTVLSPGLEDFSCRNYPPVNNFDKLRKI